VDVSLENFSSFRRLVLRSPDLQQQLRAETDMFEFPALVVTIGAANGFEFDEHTVQQAINAGRRAWIERWIA
jgi:hypothetical protein